MPDRAVGDVKPLRLTLQAFGSYPGQVTVDFARLSSHGIFGISGPTGAGKSTIFDALVYALYDDLPGFRVDGNVRSQYAADTMETRVCLEFEVKGERWRIERMPTQHLRRRRGAGDPIERKSTVLLERLGGDGAPVPGTGISRKSAVAHRIDSVVGLTKAQFEQVVLIPQGRFEEVLKADTKARAVLLRRLFPVEIYGRVIAELKAVTEDRQQAFVEARRAFDEVVERVRSSLVAALEAAGGSIDPEVRGAATFDVDQLALHMATLSSARLGLERAVATAALEHDRSARRFEEARATAQAWERWRADKLRAAGFASEEAADADEAVALQRSRRLADLDGALLGWEQASAAVSSLQPQLGATRDAVLAACTALGLDLEDGVLSRGDLASRAADRLRHEAEGLRQAITQFGALMGERRSLQARAAILAERRRAMARRSDELDGQRQAVDELAAQAEALAGVAAGLAAAEAAAQALEAERGLAARYAAAVEELRSASEARRTGATSAARARADLEDVRAAWRSGLAGRLAALLVDGDPCPTCGSLDHPEPAPKEADAPGDAALAEAEASCEAASQELQRAEARVAAAEGALAALSDARQLEDVEAELAARRADLARRQDAAARLASVQDEVIGRRASLQASACALADEARELEREAAGHAAEGVALARMLADCQERNGGQPPSRRRLEQVTAVADHLDRLAQDIGELDRAAVAERQYGELLRPLLTELGLADPGALCAWRRDPHELAERAAALAARADARAEIRHRIAEYESASGPEIRPDLAALEDEVRCTRERYLELVRRQAVMEENAGVVTAGPSLLETATKEVVGARRALEQARSMADRCSGAGGAGASARLSLENWVLADYLRQVLAHANRRLATMTGGRFALQLSDGVTDGRKAWGLELSAFDAYTGQVRPATTLSGGETFMAALALALGLADVVSGGSNREVGALFVDEGFGSLDPQSLDSVVDVLRSLEDGGRIVGVVSHVDAVQRALPSGITVRSTPSGSVAEVHYPAE